MEKKHTLVHFLTAVAFIVLAINIFSVASGKTSLVWTKREDGSYSPDGLLTLIIPFTVIILGLAGLITILNEGEFTDWLPAAGIIIAIMGGTTLFGFSLFGVFIIGGVYLIWWSISTFRNLKSAFLYSYFWEAKLMSVCRISIVVFLASFVLLYGNIPTDALKPVDFSSALPLLNWTAVSCIIGAVCLCVEALIWIKYCEY